MVSKDSLSGLIAFVRAAELQSFTLAGRRLGISSSAIGKSVSRLEERLGVRLFHRSTRQISLTSEGLDFFAHCRTLLQQLQDAEAALANSKSRPKGVLRVSLPAVGYRLISGSMREFYRRHPEIELDRDFVIMNRAHAGVSLASIRRPVTHLVAFGRLLFAWGGRGGRMLRRPTAR